MSKTFQRFVFVVTLSACAPARASETTPPGSEAKPQKGSSMTPPSQIQNAALVRRLYEECINRDQLSRVNELVAPEYIGPRGERGPDGFVTALTALRRGFPDIHFTLHDVISDGDKVAVRWTWRGTHQGSFAGLEPTGKRVDNTGIAVYAIRDGKIVQAWIETDRLGILQAMGIIDPSLGRGPGQTMVPPQRAE
jgi:predicted ester cyclase